MAQVLCVMGESGSGKTTSMRNLDPSTTFYIDCDKKGLSWKGWKNQYNVDAGNYEKTDFPSIVKTRLKWLNGERKDGKGEPLKGGLKFNTVVIDTLNGIMVAEEMRNIHVQGYGKWTDLASYIYDIVDYALQMRNDITVIFTAHSETISDDNGEVFTRIRTNGRKLDKIVLESKFSTVLLAEYKDGQYIFHTRSDRSTCKTPMDAFEKDEIPNDIAEVLKALEDY